MTLRVLDGPVALRRRRSIRPQWWLWALGAAGWLTLAGLFANGLSDTPATDGHTAGDGMAGMAGAGHDGHAGHTAAGAAALLPHAVAALAMVAVMVPLIAPNVRYAALRSPARVRGRVTVDVVAGYVLVWIGAAAVLGAGAWLLADAVGEVAAVGLVTAIALGWQLTRSKRLGLARCGALLAPPLDRVRRGRDCRRHGVALGRDCVRSCWPLMALMAVAAHNPLVVAAAFGVSWYERRRRPHHDPGTRVTALAIVLVGVAAVVSAVVPAYLSA